MRKKLDNEIIPGKRIGIYELGWDFETLKRYLGNDYQIEERERVTVIIGDCIMFWIDKETNTVTQISVYGDFRGTFKNVIGIGSTLADVERYIGRWEEELDVYILPDDPGICFELRDEDEWKELKTPIEYISVY
ncbi:hypothetical protein [Anoxybacteroides rupiense]|uniref:hypothetical protein n=1 Tax=Anoxybacteroides rupiense TaxID=311460 RepID=UPI001606C352|nr:hypothetical protein [Anoxybacillus rupiensis]MBB3907321.1 ASC-1-like (ASCH) protein [Anoxybacillus rupiensis]